MNTIFEKQIAEYLSKRAEDDVNLAKKLSNPKKTIEDCANYIIKRVKDMSEGKNCVGMTDEEVFGLAVHYYDEDDIKKEEKIPCFIVGNGTKITLSDDEMAAARQEALNDYKCKVQQEMNKKITPAPTLKKVEETKNDNQMSLFDL